MRALTHERWRTLSLVWLAGAVVVAAATVRDYGVTWDEEYYKEYGVVLLNWYSSLGADQEALSKWGLFYYGGFFDIVAQLAVSFSPYGVYETRHLVSLAFGLLGLAATCGIGWRIAGAKGGFFSLLFLTLTPAYYFHMFSNAKDIPFAALFALSLFCILRCIDALPRVPLSLILRTGIAIGLTMGVRVAGIVLLGYVALLWGGWLLGRYWIGSTVDRRVVLRQAGDLLVRFLAVAAIAWVTMVAFWPWAQVSPILHPLQALQQTTRYDWPLTVFFDGRFVKASELPRSYLPTWFAISLPEFYFAALLIGCVLSVRFLRRFARKPGHVDALLKGGLLVAVVCVPVGVQIVLRSTVYDGLRQFLFTMPALSALAGVSVAAFLGSVVRLAPRLAVLGLVLVSAGVTIHDMVDLHPYQYVYFNRLVAGGVEAGSARFETDYYGASYREGVLWLAQNYHPRTRQKVRVANPSRNFLTAYYLESNPRNRERFHPVAAWDRPHIYLSTTRWNQHKEKHGKLLHVVKRKGVPLLYVIEVAPPEDTTGPDLG